MIVKLVSKRSKSQYVAKSTLHFSHSEMTIEVPYTVTGPQGPDQSRVPYFMGTCFDS